MMNQELLRQNIENKETKINIGEIYFDKGLENIFNKNEFETEVQKINKEIEKYLGNNENSAIYNFRLYSDRNEYENYFKKNFPEKIKNFMENDMVYYYDKYNNKNVIAKFMERKILNPNDPEIKNYIKKENITFNELENQSKQNYKNNIYPTIAHELTHSHSFFKGVDYNVPGNKWAQEMVSIFIDQKMWEKYVKNYKKMIAIKAKEQAKNKDLYNEIIKDFKEGDFQIECWERIFYQFLEDRYGKEKLKDFWEYLSKYKREADFEKYFDIIFKEKLKNAMNLFQKEIVNNEF